MRLYREESFGPVAVLLRGDGDEALLRLANDSEFGLSAAIFSRDTGRALALAQRVESGICHINGPTVHDEARDALWRGQVQRLRQLWRQGVD